MNALQIAGVCVVAALFVGGPARADFTMVPLRQIPADDAPSASPIGLPTPLTPIAPRPDDIPKGHVLVHDKPVALALRRIVPKSISIEVDKEVQDVRLSFSSIGRSWQSIMDEALGGKGLTWKQTSSSVRVYRPTFPSAANTVIAAAGATASPPPAPPGATLATGAPALLAPVASAAASATPGPSALSPAVTSSADTAGNSSVPICAAGTVLTSDKGKFVCLPVSEAAAITVGAAAVAASAPDAGSIAAAVPTAPGPPPPAPAPEWVAEKGSTYRETLDRWLSTAGMGGAVYDFADPDDDWPMDARLVVYGDIKKAINDLSNSIHAKTRPVPLLYRDQLVIKEQL